MKNIEKSQKGKRAATAGHSPNIRMKIAALKKPDN
jgi:hypothetical protein